MSERKLRWGVLGTARIGRAAVIPAIHASRNGEVAAIASREELRARTFASETGIPTHFDSYDALLEHSAIDAVYIPLPNSEHRKWAVRAAEHGKHVLCEKPLALTAAECEEMIEAADANGVLLMEAFMYRFHPRTRQVLEMVRDGAVGELRMIRSAFSFRLDNPEDIRLRRELGGGALMDVGCYCVNATRAVTDAEPVEVEAFAVWSDSGIDERLAGTLRFRDGTFAQFDCGFTLTRRQFYEIAGTDATIHVPAAFRPGNVETVIEVTPDRQQTERNVVPADDEYRLMVEHFADAAFGRTELEYTARNALQGMRVIEALYQSARDGGKPKWVQQ